MKVTEVCPRCNGCGFHHLFGRFYTFPCKGCDGQGERMRVRARVWTLLRHGLSSDLEEY